MGKIQFKPSVKKRDSLFLTKHLRLLCLEIIFKNNKLFPRIILEPIGVKSHYFNEDLDVLTRNYLQE